VKTLEEIIADCAKIATVPEGTWEADQERLRREEVRDELEATIPRDLRWARFNAPELAGRVVGGADPVARSQAAVRCQYVVWMGHAGTGKTSLATAALRAWSRDAKRAAMFGRAHHLGTARIQQRAGSGEAPIVARAIAAPLLLIDDLGAEAQTQNNAIADVIRDRFDEEKPLWFTTGLTANEVAARYDGGAVRRIFERAMVIQLVRPEPA
jgi:DNA replication protein DnaC